MPAYLGRMASVSDFHTFQSSISTTLTCAVRVGDGYSTNSLCQNTGCGGEKCDKPAPCVVIPADLNLFSTHEEFIRYTIGSGVDQQCSIILGEGNHVTFRIDGVDTDYTMTCT